MKMYIKVSFNNKMNDKGIMIRTNRSWYNED